MSTTTFRKSPLFRFIALTVVAAFVGLLPVNPSFAQVSIVMPSPGQMVHATSHFEPPQMIGLKVDLKNPFSFGFIMDRGQNPMSNDVKRQEYNKIIKYFLVSLALPNKELWVNLSPFESNLTIPEVFGQTEMGRDLLAQDYMLKQFTASLMYPENGLGKKFWDKVYQEAQSRFGTTDINVNTFNKVWIVADHADVYQKGDTAFLVGSHLKVMLEQDYMAIEQNKEQFGDVSAAKDDSKDAKGQMASQLVREIIIPAIEKEVNEGKNFATVRQVYNAEILATWYKKTLRQSLLGQVFADKSKIAGQKVSDPQAKEKIYQQYLMAYSQGVFNYIREDTTPDGQKIPRQYYSGGVVLTPEAGERTIIAPRINPSEALIRMSEAGVGDKTLARMATHFILPNATDDERVLKENEILRQLSQARTEGRAVRDTIKDLIPNNSSINMPREPLQVRELANSMNIPPMVTDKVLTDFAQTVPIEDQRNVAEIGDAIKSGAFELVNATLAFVGRGNLFVNPSAVANGNVANELLVPMLHNIRAQVAAGFGEAMAKMPEARTYVMPVLSTFTPEQMNNFMNNLLEPNAGNNFVKDHIAAENKAAALTGIGQIIKAYKNVTQGLTPVVPPEAVKPLAQMMIAGEMIRQATNWNAANNEVRSFMASAGPQVAEGQIGEVSDMLREIVTKEAEEADRVQVERAGQVAAVLQEKNISPPAFEAIMRKLPEMGARVQTAVVAASGNSANAPVAAANAAKSEMETFMVTNEGLQVAAEIGKVSDSLQTILANQAEKALRAQTARAKNVAEALHKQSIIPGPVIEGFIRKLPEMSANVLQAAAVAARASGNATNANDLVIRLIGNIQKDLARQFPPSEHMQFYAQHIASLPMTEIARITDDTVSKIMEKLPTQDIKVPEIMKIRNAHLVAMKNASASLTQVVPAAVAPLLANFLVEGAIKDAGKTYGGINLSNEHLTINIKVDGAGMPMPAQFQDKSMLNFSGLKSVIRSITPLTPQNVPALYDLTKEK